MWQKANTGDNAMKGKRTPLPRPPTRKRKTGPKLAPPRPKGEVERLAVRRRAAMPYRLAGASYRSIAAKLTEDRANASADANGVSVERAMKQLPHVSKRHGLGRRDSGVGGTSARDGDAARGPDGARERPIGSGSTPPTRASRRSRPA